MFAGAARIGPASHDGVEFLAQFKFQPVGGSSFRIRAMDLLAQDAFQMALHGDLVEFLSLLKLMIRVAHQRIGLEHLSEEGFSLEKRDLAKIVSVVIQNVEHVVDHRNLLQKIFRRLDDRKTLLQKLEVAPAFFVERDNFAVEPCILSVYIFSEPREFRIFTGHLPARSRPQADFVTLNACQRADSVPLDLEEPIGIGEGPVRERGQSRRNPPGHGSSLRALR